MAEVVSDVNSNKLSYYVFYSPLENRIYLWRQEGNNRIVWSWFDGTVGDRDLWVIENYGPAAWGHILVGGFI